MQNGRWGWQGGVAQTFRLWILALILDCPSPDVTSFCSVASGSERTLPILGKARRGLDFNSLLPTVCLQLAGQAEPCSTLSAGGVPPEVRVKVVA